MEVNHIDPSNCRKKRRRGCRYFSGSGVASQIVTVPSVTPGDDQRQQPDRQLRLAPSRSTSRRLTRPCHSDGRRALEERAGTLRFCIAWALSGFATVLSSDSIAFSWRCQ
jgi:hypothetical protein